jgi:hypothetical protein
MATVPASRSACQSMIAGGPGPKTLTPVSRQRPPEKLTRFFNSLLAARPRTAGVAGAMADSPSATGPAPRPHAALVIGHFP